MANRNKSFKKRFVAFLMMIAIFCGAFYYLYEYTNVLSKVLGKKYEITFIVDGNVYNEQVLYDTIPEFGQQPIKQPTTTVEYVFDGWEPELKKVDGEATYTAKFKEQERLYNVQVVSNYANGGTYSGNGKIYSYLSDGTVSATVNNGYVFDGWYINNEFKSDELTYSFEDISKDFEIEARYSTIKKSITYNNLKEAENENPEIYDVTFGNFDLKAIKTSGYRFVGWFTGEDGTGEEVKTIDAELLNDYVLYAHWSLEAFVNLNVDGNNLQTIKTYVGDVFTLESINNEFDSSEFGMSGYSVSEWYTDESLTNKYDFESKIEENLTLFGRFDYFMDEIYFYPYLNKFNDALGSLSLTINSRDELIAFIDYVRFYDVEEQIRFKLSYLSGTGATINNEINSAYNELLDKTSFETNTVFNYSAGYTGSFYAKTSTWSQDATESADINKEFINNQKDYAVKIINDKVREENFDSFNLNKVKQAIPVSTSEQLVHILQSGYKPIVMTGSNAEKIINKAKQVLRKICNDEMSEFDKLRAIYEWIVLNVEYDNKALELSETLETSKLKKYKAWYAEGVFDDGVAVCEGFAKAFIILTKLENIPSIMVTGDGHAWNKVLFEGKWYGVDATHGSLTLSVSQSEKYEILTYKQFMFSDEMKSASKYTAVDYLEFKAEKTNCFNVYDCMDYKYNGQDFDMNVNSTNELALIFKYADNYLNSNEIDSAIIEISVDKSIDLQAIISLANLEASTNVMILFDDTDSLGNKLYSLKIVA